MSTASLHSLLERIASLFRAELRNIASRHELKLVQLEALVYLSMANRYSDTLVGLTEYLGLTKGTVSQTLKALERRGFIAKELDARDGRVAHCQLTAAGREVVAEAYPAPPLERVGPEVATAASEALEGLLRSFQVAHGGQSFGVCRTCRFFEVESETGRCGLTGEALTVEDSGRICREHRQPGNV